MIDERIASRRQNVRAERKRARLRRTVRALVLVLFLVALVLLERSPLVALEDVRVTGTERLEQSAVVEASALEQGTSTLRLRLRAAERAVEELPLVRVASARRIDPLTVEIVVEERVPALQIRGAGVNAIADRDGIIILRGVATGVPEVWLPAVPPQTGSSVDDDATLANAYNVWRSLSGPLRARVQRYVAAGPDELSLILIDGIEVRFGRAERVDEKVRALGAVLADVAGTDVAVIDVRAPRAPAVALS
jgi:cell division protein FtsQ